MKPAHFTLAVIGVALVFVVTNRIGSSRVSADTTVSESTSSSHGASSGDEVPNQGSETGSVSELIAQPVGGDERDERVAIDSSSTDSSEASSATERLNPPNAGAQVEFQLLGALETGSEIVIAAMDSAKSQAVIRVPVREGRAIVCDSLEPGGYIAALTKEQLHGPVVRFEHSSSPTMVSVEPIDLIDLKWRFVDDKSEAVIPGLEIELRRTDEIPGAPAITATGVSDAEGWVEIKDLLSGTYHISSSAEGYVPLDATYRLPADFPKVFKEGVLKFRSFWVSPNQSITVQLVNATAHGPASAFQVSYRHTGPITNFVADGSAQLDVGRLGWPLYLKLYYPNGDRGILYVEQPTEGPEDVVKLDLGGGTRLVVDLRVSPEMEHEIQSRRLYLQATFVTKHDTSLQINRRVEVAGAFEFRNVSGDAVSLNVSEATDGKMRLWATRHVELSKDRRTQTTLNVIAPPESFFVRQSADQPVAPDVGIEIRRSGDETRWIGSGDLDSEGAVSLPLIPDDDLFLSAFGGEGTIAIDVPVDLSSANVSRALYLSPMANYAFSVTVDGEPKEDCRVDLYGIETASVAMEVLWTGESGATDAKSLSTKSRVAAELSVWQDLWVEPRRSTALPGLNRIDAASTGLIEFRRDETIERLSCRSRNASLQQWIGDGLTSVREAEHGRKRVRVPVGVYSYTTEGDIDREFVVATGEVATAPE